MSCVYYSAPKLSHCRRHWWSNVFTFGSKIFLSFFLNARSREVVQLVRLSRGRGVPKYSVNTRCWHHCAHYLRTFTKGLHPDNVHNDSMYWNFGFLNYWVVPLGHTIHVWPTYRISFLVLWSKLVGSDFKSVERYFVWNRRKNAVLDFRPRQERNCVCSWRFM